MFWGHAAPVCIIDNTNLARLRGTGQDAVIVPEMEAFAKQYGFRFVCHEQGHPNRKAGEERSFWTVETNFLAGTPLPESGRSEPAGLPVGHGAHGTSACGQDAGSFRPKPSSMSSQFPGEAPGASARALSGP